jgi:hypothetical protein
MTPKQKPDKVRPVLMGPNQEQINLLLTLEEPQELPKKIKPTRKQKEARNAADMSRRRVYPEIINMQRSSSAHIAR